MRHLAMADSIREFLITTSSSHPGFHLASSLGLVELAMAMAETFDWTSDELIFDIGHQRYSFEAVSTSLDSGIPSLPPPSNSYDYFQHAGFAGLSISAALGRANRGDKWTVVLVGDGALGSGQLYEALNHAGATAEKLLVILNENGMSIGKNVGYLRGEERMAAFAKSMGLAYRGLLDGHDVPLLLKHFREIQAEQSSGATLLHISTIKGKGYRPAEEDPLAFHQPFYPFDKDTGEFIVSSNPLTDTFLSALAMLDETLVDLVSEAPTSVATVPATPPLFALEGKFPENFIDTGICEAHCMTLSSVLSLDRKVVTCMFSDFLTRCCSQLYDLGHLRAPLTCVLFFPGLNPLGSAHQAMHIVSLLRTVPNLVVLQPCNLLEFKLMLKWAISCDEPTFILAPKLDPQCAESMLPAVERARGWLIREGDRATILPIGSFFEVALELAKAHSGLEIVNPRFLKPLDFELISRSVAKTGRLLVLEDGFRTGGVGLEVIANLAGAGITFRSELVAAKDISDHTADFAVFQDKYGLSSESCLRALSNLLMD